MEEYGVAGGELVFVGEESAGEGEVAVQGADAVSGLVAGWCEGSGVGEGDSHCWVKTCWVEEGYCVSLVFCLGR